MAFVFLVVLLRTADIVITRGEDILKDIEKSFERLHTVRIPIYRGSIKDSSGRELALSVPTLSVYAHPNTRNLANKEEFIRGLASITGMPERLIRKRIERGLNGPVRIISGVDIELKAPIRKLIRETENSRFVGIQEEYRRFYPNRTLASNLIGFVGVDGIGLEGMEYMLNDYLGGGSTTALVYVNKGLGSIFINPFKGALGEEKDVLLTIDIGVQSIAERIRDDIVRKWRPKKVYILLMRLSDGHILALTTYPYFDPNRFRRYAPEKRRNYVVTDIFEPGSVMKPFFIAWALEKGYVSPNTYIDTGKGSIDVYGRRIRDIKALGKISLREVLVRSSNVGAVKVAKRLSRKDVEEMLRLFHLDQKLGVFPGEAKPKISDLSLPANIPYTAIGQGVAMNTLSLVMAFGALATGEVVRPQIVKEVLDIRGEKVFRSERLILEKDVLSEKTLNWIRKTLTLVVEEGTGRRARSKYVSIAGKTGTAQKFDPKKGKYSKEKVVTSFVGFFPVHDPRFVGAIVVDEPKGKNLYGGVVSAPYFKELAEQVIFYYGLKPDKLE